ncbi:PadR family transcriptional regulator [Paenibacillus glycinis]|uniref:PadR family transcriptional regulator n=1 Tax=Paenibacillus glycinis TaxID=2697035 RepID=A0ABW9XRM2_9BACL|nr:PadR family transcriptional regulator [Paenibacillus glycinis]NBD25206.1 PadR family transcriptional regulator [Paenibacillus glycinis]
MNTLSYGLLSLLSHAADSGYDLMLKIQPFWPAKHSQIYPLLAQLESGGYVQHKLVVQTDKPDKKIYSITDKGLNALRNWLTLPTDEPVTRDELVLKIFCMEQGDTADILHMLETRLAYYQDQLQWLQSKKETYAQLNPSPSLGIILLMQKGEFSVKADLEWTQWAMRQVIAHEKEPNPD